MQPEIFNMYMSLMNNSTVASQEILDSGLDVSNVITACVNGTKLYYKNYLDKQL